MLSRFPQDASGDCAGVPEVTRLVANALRHGGEVTGKPAPTLEDAKRLYLQDRVQGHTDERRRRLGVERAVGHVLKALAVRAAKDLVLSSVDRNQARDVRDHLSRDVGMTPPTVRRTLNDIRAVFRFGLIEFGLADGSPFDRITGIAPASSDSVSSLGAAIREAALDAMVAAEKRYFAAVVSGQNSDEVRAVEAKLHRGKLSGTLQTS